MRYTIRLTNTYEFTVEAADLDDAYAISDEYGESDADLINREVTEAIPVYDEVGGTP